MSNTDEELLGEESDVRIRLDEDFTYTTRFVGEGRLIDEGMEESSKNSIVKNVGKLFNFGALTSKKRGSASITKRGASLRKASAKSQQTSGLVA